MQARRAPACKQRSIAQDSTRRRGLEYLRKRVVIVNGGPGTGKSVLAVNLVADFLRANINAQHATGSKASTERAMYCFMVGECVVVLHAFIKKSQQTPDRELKLARRRPKELFNG